MTLIKSISGIRGTIGGTVGDNLTAQDIVECTAAFGSLVLKNTGNSKIVIGRDARISGQLMAQLVSATLQTLGIDVVDLGLSTTPTVEMAVPAEQAGGGVINTASHNPRNWNALKFLNEKGEFISKADGQELLMLIEKGDINYAEVDELGKYRKDDNYLQFHIDQILAYPLVQAETIRTKKYKVVVDAINSSGAIAVPLLLEQLGCEVIVLNEEADGNFAHNPEPLPENLLLLSETVVAQQADLGISVDPDVDRLALVCEDGTMFGEEYTLVAVADYFLQKRDGAVVSNLSSTRALRDVARHYGNKYFAAAVGEVNVVARMKETDAIIGGEGNGGIIVPDFHYGRDALIGIALFLSFMAEMDKSVLELKKTYPDYTISKNKIDLNPEIDVNLILEKLRVLYKNEELNTEDGLKIDFEKGWVHLRKSNTEPILRIYSESTSPEYAEQLSNQVISEVRALQAPQVKS